MPSVAARTPGETAARVAIYAVLGLFVLYYLAPFFVMLLTSIKPLDEIRTGTLISLPHDVTFEPWRKAWGYATIGVTNEGIKGFFWNSIRMVIPAVLLSTFLGAANGYVLAKWKFKGSDAFFAMLLLGCFIPFQVVLLPMARTLGLLGLSESMWGLVLVHTVYGLAFTTLFFRNFYVGVPTELVNAARIDGAGFLRIFWKIMLPVSKPIFMVSIIWQTTQIWNDFLFGVCFSTGATQPVTVALNNLVNTSSSIKEYNVDMAGAIIAALPTLFVYFVAGKYFVRGLTAGAVKG
ncbi:carbohydrate ABC transporter permease [Pseudodesulfovibrio tunisiensis]|uniref:carbohydrate ABC transporter permease n=1 Tax=Pseudodesulfovibrio tunisiensis TaxID=463192 RepID=UPI001FB30E4D|nr:carbohydrate ABC transporter permease [Pseudodesulfovibrio tunisiensis]